MAKKSKTATRGGHKKKALKVKEKEAGPKARARSAVAAGLGRFGRHEEGDASEEEKETGAKARTSFALAAAENFWRRSIKAPRVAG